MKTISFTKKQSKRRDVLIGASRLFYSHLKRAQAGRRGDVPYGFYKIRNSYRNKVWEYQTKDKANKIRDGRS